MSRMSDRRETWESYFGERPQHSVMRLFKRHLALERKHTEKLLDHLYLAIKTEVALVEKRMTTKLEDIDASLNLIAGELARRGEDPPSGAGS